MLKTQNFENLSEFSLTMIRYLCLFLMILFLFDLKMTPERLNSQFNRLIVGRISTITKTAVLWFDSLIFEPLIGELPMLEKVRTQIFLIIIFINFVIVRTEFDQSCASTSGWPLNSVVSILVAQNSFRFFQF